MVRSSWVLGAALFLALVTLAVTSRADLPPPDNKKFVPYGFRVENLKAFPDYVVLAFPWSLSNGAPTKEHALVEEGKTVSLGRRSSAPALYAMKRTEYDAWKSSYEPTHEFDDPALEQLFSSSKVIRCNVEIAPKFLLEKDDPKQEFVDAFRVEAIAGAACRVVPVDAKVAALPATPTPTPVTPQPKSEAPAPPPSTPAKSGGCGGCETQRKSDLSFAIWALLALAGLLLRRRS